WVICSHRHSDLYSFPTRRTSDLLPSLPAPKAQMPGLACVTTAWGLIPRCVKAYFFGLIAAAWAVGGRVAAGPGWAWLLHWPMPNATGARLCLKTATPQQMEGSAYARY